MDTDSGFGQLFFTTWRIETFDSGSSAVGEATSFVVGVDTTQGRVHVGVTNKHVLDSAFEARLHFLLADPDGKWQRGEGAWVGARGIQSQWVGHPSASVDVAAFPIGSVIALAMEKGYRPYYKSVPESMFALSEGVAALDAIEQVAFVGYPAGIYDTHNLTPVLRTGVTATPLSLNYRGTPSFLIDGSVFPGSSGSPVFLLDQGFRRHQGLAEVSTMSRLLLLGVLAAVHTSPLVGDVVDLRTKSISVSEQPMNLGIVYKASAVRECIDVLLRQHGLERVEGAPR